MKKLLLASTAIIATAGMAAADVVVDTSGSARFGVIYDGARTANQARLHTRYTLNLDGASDLDSGVEVFARVRIRGDNTAGSGDTPAASGVSAPRIGLTSGNLTVAFGNINGAWESMPGLYGGSVGLTGLGYANVLGNSSAADTFEWDSFDSSGGGAQGVEVIYSGDNIGVQVSRSEANDRTAAHISYAGDDWTFALGHQKSDADNTTFTGATVSGDVTDGVSIGAAYGDVGAGRNAARLNGTFEVSADTDIVAYATNLDGVTDNSYGLGFTHSLGGATLAGGVVRYQDGNNRADLGVRFNF